MTFYTLVFVRKISEVECECEIKFLQAWNVSKVSFWDFDLKFSVYDFLNNATSLWMFSCMVCFPCPWLNLVGQCFIGYPFLTSAQYTKHYSCVRGYITAWLPPTALGRGFRCFFSAMPVVKRLGFENLCECHNKHSCDSDEKSGLACTGHESTCWDKIPINELRLYLTPFHPERKERKQKGKQHQFKQNLLIRTFPQLTSLS